MIAYRKINLLTDLLQCIY